MKTNLQLFGGRGGSSGGGGGKSSVARLMTQSGIEADLSENPLVYSDSNSEMTDAQRKTIEAHESKRLNAKIEYSYTVDKDGDVIGIENRGGTSGVRTPASDLNHSDATFTHNHPRSNNNAGERGVIGGTFSPADMDAFTSTKVKTFRASAYEGTYSIAKKSNFDSRGFSSYFKEADRNSTAKYNAKHNALKKDYDSYKISWNTYISEHAKIFNGMLVENHNALLAGQKKYGYSYGLEARHG